MALDTELRATTYAGNASTSLAYPILFPYLDSADIKVQVQAVGAATPTVLAESAYTVHDEEDDGAPYVTTTAAYPSTTTVQIFRFMDYLQPVVLPEGGKLSSVIIEQALDRVTMLAMQGGDGGYTLPSAGSRDSVVFANAGARATTVAARVGQLGVQTDNGSVWRALSTFAGDWQEIMPAIRSDERNVHTQAQLIAAFADTAALTIYVRKDIDLSVSLTMGANKTLVMGDYRFAQFGSSTLLLMGLVVADRRQIFSGFSAGQIKGTFGKTEVYPEWWGLQVGRHDIAINCAIQSSTRAGATGLTFPDWHGTTVSLGPRIYDVARPIDCSQGYIHIKGSGSAQTIILATSAWVPDTWEKAEVWDSSANTPNHAALIWIGGINGVSYRNQVTGVYLACTNASFAWRLTNKRVSGISSKGQVEECSIIDEVLIEGPTGFGIGFCPHRDTTGVLQTPVLNGLSITNFWITGRTVRDMVPLYFPYATNNVSVDVGTVDMSMSKAVSSAWNLAPADPEPAWVLTYPLIGIKAQGNMSISNVHIEGPVIGIHVEENNTGGNNISIKSVNFWQLQDPERGALYYSDGLSGVDFTTNLQVTNVNAVANNATNDSTRYFGYGTGVLISRPYSTVTLDAVPYNVKDRVNINGIKASGGVTFLLRDAMYNKNIRAFGQGQSPTIQGLAGIAHYSRGNAYAWTTTLPYTAIGAGGYDPTAPTSTASLSRTFFVGPIF